MAASSQWRYPLQCRRPRALTPALTRARIADGNSAKAHSKRKRSMIDWSVEGVAFGNCNCDYGCPCQFERRPTQGPCRGFEVVRIDKGHFGDVPLDGLHLALLYAWPGAIFEGGGAMQAIIDERANERQREALVTVGHGGETAGATHEIIQPAGTACTHHSRRPACDAPAC